MGLISDLKDIVEAIPSEIEHLAEEVFDATWDAAKPILTGIVSQFEAEVVANATNPEKLIATAATIATSAIPTLEAAGITAVGTTLLNWVLALMHPAIAAAASAPSATTATPLA